MVVIFDYSGTLSVEAPDFGRPDNLARALEESGLAALGVADANIFWEKIVFPTWDVGSRTTIGYARVISDRIASLHLPPGAHRAESAASCPQSGASCPQSAASCPQSAVSPSAIVEAAKRFVAMYLNCSRMEPLWRPLFEKLVADQNIVVVIATDHYAEATDAMIHYLKSWGIAAAKADNIAATKPAARQAITAAVTAREVLPEDSVFSPSPREDGKKGRFASVIVANSADLGFWKADRRFWEILRAQLPGRFRSVLIVDDFGFNEADANGYGQIDLVRERRRKTKALLREVFQTSVSTISFFLKKDTGNREDAKIRKIRETVRRIAAAVRPVPGSRQNAV